MPGILPLHFIGVTLRMSGLRIRVRPHCAHHLSPLCPGLLKYFGAAHVLAEYRCLAKRITRCMHGNQSLAAAHELLDGLLGLSAPARTAVIGNQNIIGLQRLRGDPIRHLGNSNVELSGEVQHAPQVRSCRAPVMIVAACDNQDSDLTFRKEETIWDCLCCDAGGEKQGRAGEDCRSTHDLEPPPDARESAPPAKACRTPPTTRR